MAIDTYFTVNYNFVIKRVLVITNMAFTSWGIINLVIKAAINKVIKTTISKVIINMAIEAILVIELIRIIKPISN